MRRTNVYLDDAQTVALDEIAHGQGISRAELVRRLLDRGISSSSVDQEADLTAIVDSFGVMAHDVSDRGPDERAAHLDRLRHL
ncbi:ribbon-helix-helix domain-containing protein [soil metagenome]